MFKKLKDAHSRIIWGISWSHDDALFATASREKHKSVKVWQGTGTLDQIGELYNELPEENPSATAIRFFPSQLKGAYALIVGLETGDLLIWSHNKESNTWMKLYQVPNFYTHCAAVRRIKFNKRYSHENDYVVATCGDDHSVRLFSLAF